MTIANAAAPRWRPKPIEGFHGQHNCDPRYKFIWQGARCLVPFLHNWGPTGNGTGGGDDVPRQWDYAGRQHWAAGTTNSQEQDELGACYDFPSNSGSNMGLSSSRADLYDIAANEPFTFAWVCKVHNDVDDEMQVIRTGSAANLIIYDDIKVAGFRDLWVRLAGNDDIPPSAATRITSEEYHATVITGDPVAGLVSIYIDGALLISAAISGGTAIWDTNHIWGSMFATETFQGRMTYHSFYNRAWGASEAAFWAQDPWGGFRPHMFDETVGAPPVPNSQDLRLASHTKRSDA